MGLPEVVKLAAARAEGQAGDQVGQEQRGQIRTEFTRLWLNQP